MEHINKISHTFFISKYSICSFLAKLINTIKPLVSKAFRNMYFIVFTTNVLLSTSKQQKDNDKSFEF